MKWFTKSIYVKLNALILKNTNTIVPLLLSYLKFMKIISFRQNCTLQRFSEKMTVIVQCPFNLNRIYSFFLRKSHSIVHFVWSICWWVALLRIKSRFFFFFLHLKIMQIQRRNSSRKIISIFKDIWSTFNWLF